MRKRILALLLTLMLAVSALAANASAADTTRFSDLTDSETALAAETLRLMGALDGFEDGTFRPGEPLTRAQFCKIVVYAMNGESELGLYDTITVFPDVKGSHWAASYVNMAAKGKDVIAGFPDGKFHPEQAVTAGQAVTILLRLLDYQDANIGGVWPASYMAAAQTIGLLDGIDTTGTAVLNRGQAARLFLNLLRSDCRGGGSYLSTIGGAVLEDVVLVSSTATGSDGRPTAMQLSGGQVYSMAYKASNGSLNGHRGALLLNEQGKVLTFVPTDVGSGKTITIASATATRITDTAGAGYTVDRGAQAYYNGEQTDWTSVYAWLNAGTSVTIYTAATGSVEYVFVGDVSADTAIVIQADRSTAGFSALTGGAAYTIYKNGAPATVSDLRKYDVATYSAATGTIRVCDTRVSVYYESCTPNAKEPMEISVLGGTKLTVLPSAMESVAALKPGSQMTLLLTDDGQVAGALSGGSAKANALGIVQGGQVQLLCGSTRIAVGTSDDAADYEGRLVRISSTKSDGVKLAAPTDGVTGALDVAARTLGGKELASNVMLLDGTESISLSQVEMAEVPASLIAYARTNWAGKVDLIQIGDSKGGTVYYGRAVVDTRTEYDLFGETEVTTLNVQYSRDGAAASSGAYPTGYLVKTGDYVAATLRNGRFASVTVLTALKNVPNSAWSGPSGVTVGGTFYTVPEDVLCYNRDSAQWLSLSAAHAYAQTCNLYVRDGVVRVVEIRN